MWEEGKAAEAATARLQLLLVKRKWLRTTLAVIWLNEREAAE